MLISNLPVALIFFPTYIALNYYLSVHCYMDVIMSGCIDILDLNPRAQSFLCNLFKNLYV